MAANEEPEIAWGQRAFPKAQELLTSTPVERLNLSVTTGWHDTTTDPLTGAFAVVRIGGPLEDLVGDIVRVSFGPASSFIYVIGARDVVPDLSLARRAFLSLAVLAAESIQTVVEICE